MLAIKKNWKIKMLRYFLAWWINSANKLKAYACEYDDRNFAAHENYHAWPGLDPGTSGWKNKMQPLYYWDQQNGNIVISNIVI